MPVGVDQPVFFVQYLLIALAKHVCHIAALLLGEFFSINLQQAHQRIAGDDVEVDVGQRFQLFDGLRGSDQGQEQAQLGDLARLFHDVHAKQVVGDDGALDEIGEALVFGLPLLELFGEALVVEEFDAPDNRRVDIDERLHGGDQESA